MKKDLHGFLIDLDAIEVPLVERVEPSTWLVRL